MPFQPVGNGAEVVIHGMVDSQEVVTTFGLLGIVGFGLLELQTTVDIVYSTWQTQFLPRLSTAYSLNAVSGRGLRTASDFEYSVAFTGTNNGQLTEPAMPNNVSFAIKLSTGNSGRSGRGRSFWPVFTEAQVTGNKVNAATRAGILSAYSTLNDAVAFQGEFLLSVITRYTANTLRPVAVAQPVQSISTTDDIVDSMRRRLPKRGN